jgi:hypothetical protein
MWKRRFAVIALLLAGSLAAAPVVLAQARAESVKLLTAQREALVKLAFMDGVWRGQASTVLPDGSKHDIVQTERIGPMLDGTLKVIEGRGYDADGSVTFNALGVVSYDLAKQGYSMRSYAMGYAGDFVLMPAAAGYTWEIPMGPVTVRYTAEVKDGHWHEVGDRLAPGKDPVRFFEMNLTRVGDTTWPAGGAIPRE